MINDKYTKKHIDMVSNFKLL